MALNLGFFSCGAPGLVASRGPLIEPVPLALAGRVLPMALDHQGSPSQGSFWAPGAPEVERVWAVLIDLPDREELRFSVSVKLSLAGKALA